MKNKMYPCLWFDGNAKEAADYYCTAFENSSITSENPLVVIFELDDFQFMGLNGGPVFKKNPSISFFAYCDSAEEIEKKWKHLSADGSVMMALDKYPWSEKYGWCQDKFGVNWQLMMSNNNEQKIVPALMFTQQQAGKAEEAINFYTDVFSQQNGSPKSAEVKMVSRYEKGEHDVEGYIKHAQFTLNDQLFVAMDSSGAHNFTFNEGVSIVVPCETQEEIDYFWNKLTEGGNESQCGWLKDKFGVSWQIVPSMLGKLMSDPARREKVMQAFMQMKKFDIKKLEEA